MRKSKFTDEQIAFALKQAELGISVEDACRKMGTSDATPYVWRKKYVATGADRTPSLGRRSVSAPGRVGDFAKRRLLAAFSPTGDISPILPV